MKLKTVRERRHKKIRMSVKGTPERPRLAVFRSNRYISAQVIDDGKGHTLAAARGGKKKPQEVGRAVAEAAKGKGISSVVFDRAGYQYRGKVKAVAEGAREAGLNF